MTWLLASLPEGSRSTDYVSLGVTARTSPLLRVRRVLLPGPGLGS